MQSPLFDMFLCHNSADKAAVSAIEAQLRARGMRCWFDRHELRPGSDWKAFVRAEWPRIGALVVCLGPNGLSPGQLFEIDALAPVVGPTQSVVPVLLPSIASDVAAHEVVPEQLKGLIWVDFRRADGDPLQALIWGANGENPHIRLSVGSYYRDADGLEDDALRTCLGRITKEGHHRISYQPQATEAMKDLFRDPLNDQNVIRFHDGVSVPITSYGPGAVPQDRWNKDHIWPKAFGFADNATAHADLHNIAVADAVHNSRRSAGLFYDRRLDHLEREMEVAPERHFDPRGVIARACLYMAVRYQGVDGDPELTLDERAHVIGEPHIGSLETLLLWNKLARVSRAERIRNDQIAERQGNRNPFVDRPDFADLIWYPV
ncbi:endonuclease [Tateyamaria armeniaca]|uniref:Endonuclease n=1 Tax=Tateyamaria armeniaca TaxID=2518930 RepID=A0ABW8V3X8_9RHOB